MQLRPPDAPLDAFFAPVRRRHPDVDIVVLPPEQPPSAEPVDPAQVDATLDRVRDTAARVCETALRGTVPPARWRFGPDDGTVVASVRVVSTTPDGFGALVALRGDLESGGWRVRRQPGEVERLSGVMDDVRVQGSYAASTGTLLLDVRSEPLYVGRAAARDLVRR